MKRISHILLCAALGSVAMLLAACNPPPTPVAMPTPTRILTAITDRELLGAGNVTATCDAPAEATFTCEEAAGQPRLSVEITASTFARWGLQWANAKPLTGNETLAVRFTSSGTLAPNLYLVTSTGARASVPFQQFGLPPGTQTLHVPLREVRDLDGNPLDFATINALEVVFEWGDMQGTLVLESLRIDSVWRERVTVGDEAEALAAALQMPDGFTAQPIAEGLEQLTQIDFTTEGDLLVTLQNGRVWRYRDTNGDDIYDERLLYTVGPLDLVGLLYDPTDGGVWLGSRGQLLHTLDTDGNGVADTRTTRFEGVEWGRHQNNGMAWNPDPDPFTGEPGGTWLYFGFGSVDDLEVGGAYNATVVRFPRTGQSAADLEVVSTGNRNAYDVVWADLPLDPADPNTPRTWQLFASENGPDFNEAPDEVNHIRWGHHYGFPDQFGAVGAEAIEGDPYSGPVYEVTPHASADGLAYIDNAVWPADYRTLYVALFGEVFSPTPVGHIVERITLSAETTPDGEVTYRGEPSPFIVGLDRPLPLVTAPNGNMLVGDYATGVIYEIAYLGE